MSIDNYLTGVDKLDDHHKILIDTVSVIVDLIRNKQISNARIIASTLAIALRQHCNEEEKIFSKFNYPNKEEHIKEHTILLGKMDRVCLFLSEGIATNDAISWELVRSLQNIFLDHIILHDMKYAEFLKKYSKSVDTQHM